jgi:hypothetical protein
MCPANADVDHMLAAMLSDHAPGTGMVEFPDFVTSYCALVGTDAAGGCAQVTAAMRIFDAPGHATGTMSVKDLEDAMLKYGECLDETEMAHLRRFMEPVVKDGSGATGGGAGTLDYEALIKTLTSTQVVVRP